MFFRNLSNQFLHDLKANWQKSVLLGVLFVIGLFFWVPPLYRALVGHTPGPAVATTPATAHQPASVVSPRVVRKRQAPRTSSASTQPNRSDAGRRRRIDPLAQSVAPSDIRKDPFRVDLDQFPPPVVFVKEPKVIKPKQTDSVANTPPQLPEGLVLKSTILGANRRAAFINRRLYFTGMDVPFDGEVYKLIAVHARRVVLRHGSADFDLTIRKKSSSENIGQQRSFVQPTGKSQPAARTGL